MKLDRRPHLGSHALAGYRMKVACALLAIGFVCFGGSGSYARGASMPSYDLDSLVYLSTGIVEATLHRTHAPGTQSWQDTFTADVERTISGSIAAGTVVDLGTQPVEYVPSDDDQHCILFLTGRSMNAANPSHPYSIVGSGMFLIDPGGRVHNYAQRMNPGPYMADSSALFGGTAAAGQSPTVAQEQDLIEASLRVVSTYRRLLTKTATREDVVPLMGVLRRWTSAAGDGLQRDAIAEAACAQLVSLHDPMVDIDAIGVAKDWSSVWLLQRTLDNTEGRATVARLVADRRAPKGQRLAAAHAVGEAFGLGGDADTGVFAGRILGALISAHLDPDVHTALIGSLHFLPLPADNQNNGPLPAAVSKAEAGARTQEDRFAIEGVGVAYWGPDALHALDPSIGPVLSIVRPAMQTAAAGGVVNVSFDIVGLACSPQGALQYDFQLTAADGRTYEVAPEYPSNITAQDTSHGWESGGGDRLTLPPGLAPGSYSVALRFFDDRGVVSVGHSAKVVVRAD